MSHKLRILFAEDLEMDYQLAIEIIKKENILSDVLLVETPEDFKKALIEFKPDVVISDYSMPQFDGLEALQIARSFDELMPFIIITGSRNEEIAVKCMREGADDYVIKENMKRLPFAVIEAFKRKQSQREREIYFAKLQEKEALFKMITENSTDVLFLLDLKLNYLYVSPAVEQLNGYTVEETLQQHIIDILTPESSQLIQKVFEEEYKREISGKNPPDHTRTIAFTEYNSKGEVIWVESALKFVHNDMGKPIGIMGVSRDITEKKRIEKRMQESEALLNFSQEIAQMGSFELDMKTNSVIWSEHNYRIMGIKPHSIEPDLDYFYSRVLQDDLPKVKASVEQLRSQKKPVSYTFRIVWPDGQIRWLRNEVVPFFEQDELILIKGVNLDITDRKKDQKQLLDADMRLKLALEASNQGLYDHYLQSDKVIINDYYAAMLGYEPEEFTESTEFWMSRIHPDDKEKVAKIYNSYLAGELPEYRTEFRQKTKSGQWKWTLSMGKIVENDKDGKPYRMLGTHIDIDRIKRNEFKLEESKNYLENLINTIDIAIIETDQDFKITRFNKAAEQLTGLTFEQTNGQSIAGLFSMGDSPRLEEMARLVLEEGGELKNEKVVVKRADGTDRTVNWNTKNLFNKQTRKRNATIAIGYDITELLQAQHHLRQSEERFKQIFDNAPIGLISFDKDLVLRNLNDSFAEILGSDRDKLTNLDMKKLPDESLNDALGKVSSGKRAGFNGPYKVITSGKQIEIKALFAPLFDNNNKFDGGVGIIEDISEQTAAQKNLKESEERFSKIFYSSPVAKALILVDDLSVFDANDAWCRFTGYTREMALGKSLKELKFIQKEVLSEIIAEQKKTGIVYQSELSFIDRTGNEKTGLLSLESYYMAGKEYLITAILDITERKIAELELIKLTRAVEQSPVSIVITDLDGTVEYVNPRVTEVSGYLPTELIGQNPRIFSSGEKPPEYYKVMYETLNNGEVWAGEFHNRKKNGSLYWEKATIAPVINDEGVMTHYLAVKEDITIVKQLSENLAESEKRYRDMFRNSPLPMWIYDVNTLKFEEVNQVAVSRYGFTEEEFKSMTLEAIRPEEDIPLLHENVKQVTDEFQDNQTWRHKTKDGKVMDVEIVSHAIPSPPGKKLRLVLVNDVTEKIRAANTLKEAMAMAEASDKLKTSFLNNISHEVRTPLNGIMGAATLMSDPEVGASEMEELVEIVQESSDRLIQTITDYMDISLLTSQNMETYRKQFDVRQMLQLVVAKFQQRFETKGIDFRLEMPVPEQIIKLKTDEELLSKAVSHLLSNAYKFTNEGEVVLSCQINNNNLEITIKDTGIGIAEENQEQIFEYFSQEDQSSVRRFEGSGLGLSIVKGIMSVLEGEVTLQSIKGKGSEFRLLLPLSEEKVPAEGKVAAVAKSPVVMIAEDEDSNFYVMELLMRQMDVAEVIRAENGLEAVALTEKRDDIGLILMDIKMPEMDGVEATKLIKAKKPDLPVIAITAFAMSGDEHRIKEAGCDDYMAKPISMKKLIEKLKQFGLKLRS